MAADRMDIATYGEKQHLKYIEGVQQYDPSQGAESAWVPQKTTESAAKPYIPAEFDPLFSLTRPHPLAHFSPPTTGIDREGLFFRQAILPSGSYEQMDTLLEKLAQFEQTIQNLPASTVEEFNKIKDGIETENKLTRMFELITARRNQFQRG